MSFFGHYGWSNLRNFWDTKNRCAIFIFAYINVIIFPHFLLGLISIIFVLTGSIYEARRELLGGNEPAITAEIPESYTIPAPPGNLIPSFGAFNPFSPSHAATMNNSPRSPFVAEMNYAGMGSPIFGHNPPTPGT